MRCDLLCKPARKLVDIDGGSLEKPGAVRFSVSNAQASKLHSGPVLIIKMPGSGLSGRGRLNIMPTGRWSPAERKTSKRN